MARSTRSHPRNVDRPSSIRNTCDRYFRIGSMIRSAKMNAIASPKLMPPFQRTAASGIFPTEHTNEITATNGPTIGLDFLNGSKGQVARWCHHQEVLVDTNVKGLRRSMLVRNPCASGRVSRRWPTNARAFWPARILVLPASSVRHLRFRAALITPCGSTVIRIRRGLQT